MVPICKSFVANDHELDNVLIEAKSTACPHCREVGTLVGHGKLRGYSTDGVGQVVRGRRLLCSDRYCRRGCGRTMSVLLCTFVAAFVVTTQTLSRMFAGVVGGLCCKVAWENANSGLSLRSGYRLWERLRHTSHRLRTALLGVCEPPSVDSKLPQSQLFAHLRAVFGTTDCVLAGFQRRFQTPLLA